MDDQTAPPTDNNSDRLLRKGIDFEFLITGDINIQAEDIDYVMTPNTFKWEKVSKGNYCYYQVGKDEFTYSWEIPGIQMIFNKEIIYDKALKIVEEAIANIKAFGQEAELVVLNSSNIYRFLHSE